MAWPVMVVVVRRADWAMAAGTWWGGGGEEGRLLNTLLLSWTLQFFTLCIAVLTFNGDCIQQ